MLIDAQTIQMCKDEEASGRKGSLGRQFLFAALPQAIISPLIGQLMDYVSNHYGTGETNYIVSFIAHDTFLLIGMALLLFTNLDVQLPKSIGFKGVAKIFRDIDNCVFLILMFTAGNLWGFLETYLFVYLKEDMGAPIYLLGLTITAGAIVSMPFLYISDYLVARIGQTNIFIIALWTYSVRYIGYSYITSPWQVFPFEAMEIFTLNLFKIAQLEKTREKAPTGLLATLNGLSGCMHYGLGKGTFYSRITLYYY